MLFFTRAEDLVAYLRAERKKPERFVTRFILIRGCRGWDELIPMLSAEVDEVIKASEFCSGPDVCPDLYQIKVYLQTKAREVNNVLLIPLGECIRLDSENAEILRWLAQVESSKIRRIYVPLVAGEESFNHEMSFLPRHDNRLLPAPCFLESDGDADVIVAPFHSGFGGRRVANGIKEYLALWERGSVGKVWLVTKLAPWLPVQRSQKECHVRLYPSSFAYVYKRTGWKDLLEEWGTPEEWEWLATNMEEGETFDQVAARLLKVREFDANILFALWNTSLDEKQQWLVWLWGKKCCKPESYLWHVLRKSRKRSDFYKDAVLAIFDLLCSKDIVAERKKLLRNLGIIDMTPEFWERYKKLEDPIKKLATLTDHSEREREQAVLVVGELLRRGSCAEWWEYLETVFPALARYLSVIWTGDEFVDKYFAVYKSCRIMDEINDDLRYLINEWVQRQLLWSYPTRSDLLSRYATNGIEVFWVDGMGFEWAGLLEYFLAVDGKTRCEVKLARSQLPTTTEANKQWTLEQAVDRQLDVIAHHYEYRFPNSFLESMKAIENIAKQVLNAVALESTVVVTSDHGMSRFAAINEDTIDAPAGTTVEHWGRYAKIINEEGILDSTSGAWVVDKGSVILLNHSRFRGGTRRGGEVHGGATPEEVLVPIIMVRREEVMDFSFQVLGRIVRIGPKGEGRLNVRCDTKIPHIELLVLDQRFPGQSEGGLEWSFLLKGLKAGKYVGKLYSQNRFAGEIDFEVVRGIEEDDLGL